MIPVCRSASAFEGALQRTIVPEPRSAWNLNADPHTQVFVDYQGAIDVHQKPFFRGNVYGASKVLGGAALAPFGAKAA